jgi:hypothetical protein
MSTELVHNLYTFYLSSCIGIILQQIVQDMKLLFRIQVARPDLRLRNDMHIRSGMFVEPLEGGVYYRKNVWFKVLQVPRQVKREVLELWMLGSRS